MDHCPGVGRSSSRFSRYINQPERRWAEPNAPSSPWARDLSRRWHRRPGAQGAACPHFRCFQWSKSFAGSAALSGLLVSQSFVLELMPPQRPRLPIGATCCLAGRFSLPVETLLTLTGRLTRTTRQANHAPPSEAPLCSKSVSCELGFIETTKPTGGTQHREYSGGPTNGQAAVCRRRLAAKAKPRPEGGLNAFFFSPIASSFFSGASSSLPNRALRPPHQLHPEPSPPP